MFALLTLYMKVGWEKIVSRVMSIKNSITTKVTLTKDLTNVSVIIFFISLVIFQSQLNNKKVLTKDTRILTEKEHPQIKL